MSIKFTSKNVKFPGALKGYAEKSLKNIEKFSGGIIDSEVVVSEEKQGFKIEINIKTKMNNYHVVSTEPLVKQALRNALNSIKNQAKKNKEKLKGDKRRGKKNFLQGFFSGEAPAPEAAEESGQERIQISRNYSQKPLSIEEAVFFLKESGENAYLFLNVESNNISVVFFNKSDEISLIDVKIEK
ncbi:MAG: ribosome-associated translation inhibitor RaiA [Candidatus Aminicenantes bacterium]|nr:ribosome-associated translation inhibitor RaiA [Candidatus Aminicenantes bacterium]